MNQKEIDTLVWELFKRGLVAVRLDDGTGRLMLTEAETNTVVAPIENINTWEAIRDWVQDMPYKYTEAEAKELLNAHSKVDNISSMPDSAAQYACERGLLPMFAEKNDCVTDVFMADDEGLYICTCRNEEIEKDCFIAWDNITLAENEWIKYKVAME